MAEQIPGLLKSAYVYGSCALFIAVLWVAFLRGRRAGYRRAWAPLVPMIQGNIQSKHATSTMTGTFHGRPVAATITSGRRESPAVFTVQMAIPRCGRDWVIAHRSDKFLGSETWRVWTRDPALQARMNAADVAGVLRRWPEDTLVRYDSGRGTLALQEQVFPPSPEHFRAQLGVLETLAEVNRLVNGS